MKTYKIEFKFSIKNKAGEQVETYAVETKDVALAIAKTTRQLINEHDVGRIFSVNEKHT